jgi:hypothetical protein
MTVSIETYDHRVLSDPAGIIGFEALGRGRSAGAPSPPPEEDVVR